MSAQNRLNARSSGSGVLGGPTVAAELDGVLVGVVARVSRDLARASLGIAKELDAAAEFAAGQVSRSEPKASVGQRNC